MYGNHLFECVFVDTVGWFNYCKNYFHFIIDDTTVYALSEPLETVTTETCTNCLKQMFNNQSFSNRFVLIKLSTYRFPKKSVLI